MVHEGFPVVVILVDRLVGAGHHDRLRRGQSDGRRLGAVGHVAAQTAHVVVLLAAAAARLLLLLDGLVDGVQRRLHGLVHVLRGGEEADHGQVHRLGSSAVALVAGLALALPLRTSRRRDLGLGVARVDAPHAADVRGHRHSVDSGGDRLLVHKPGILLQRSQDAQPAHRDGLQRRRLGEGVLVQRRPLELGASLSDCAPHRHVRVHEGGAQLELRQLEGPLREDVELAPGPDQPQLDA